MGSCKYHCMAKSGIILSLKGAREIVMRDFEKRKQEFMDVFNDPTNDYQVGNIRGAVNVGMSPTYIINYSVSQKRINKLFFHFKNKQREIEIPE